MTLAGKHILITGGSSGLGLALTKLAYTKKAKISVLGRSKDSLEQTGLLGAINFIQSDITNSDSLKKAMDNVDPVDVLINNAGVWLDGPLETNTVNQIKHAIAVNLLGVILTTKFVLPKMKQKSKGWIVNISSTSGLQGRPNQSIYAATKFGVQGFTEALKQELWDTPINVIGVYPGGMQTEFFSRGSDKKDLSSYMDPEEVAKVILFAVETDNGMLLNPLVINRRK